MKVLPAAPIVVVVDGMGELSAELELQPTVTAREVHTAHVRIAKRNISLAPFLSCVNRAASELKICSQTADGLVLSAYRFETTRSV